MEDEVLVRSYTTSSGCDRRSITRREGFTLLEVVVAIALLVIGGLTIVASVSESLSAAARVRERENELRDASRFLEAVALWTRNDLDLRLGVRRQGRWYLNITRRSAFLYEVDLLDSTGERQLLRSALFRSEPSHER